MMNNKVIYFESITTTKNRIIRSKLSQKHNLIVHYNSQQRTSLIFMNININILNILLNIISFFCSSCLCNNISIYIIILIFNNQIHGRSFTFNEFFRSMNLYSLFSISIRNTFTS